MMNIIKYAKFIFHKKRFFYLRKNLYKSEYFKQRLSIEKRRAERSTKTVVENVKQHIHKKLYLDQWSDRSIKNLAYLLTRRYNLIVPQKVWGNLWWFFYLFSCARAINHITIKPIRYFLSKTTTNTSTAFPNRLPHP